MRLKIKRAIEASAEAEGAVRVEWILTGRHEKAIFYLAEGDRVTMPLSRGTSHDEYKLRGWVRQAIRNRPIRS